MSNFNKNPISNMLAVVAVLALVGFGGLALWRSGELAKIAPGGTSQSAAVIAANLLTTANFAVLAGASIVDANISHVTGDVGLSPASGSFFGALTCGEVTGNIYSTDTAGPLPCRSMQPALLIQAQNDLTTAYNATAGETPATTLPGSDNQLGGQTLDAGIYTFSAASVANLTGTLILDGQGDPNAVFVFQSASTLVTASGSVIHLINGAQACNVFWQVGSSATFGTGSQFVGTVMANQSITDNGGSIINGRLLASVATVTLNNTTVTVPSCSGAGTATLHVVKSVLNLASGTAVPSDFSVHVKSATSTLDVAGSPQPGAAIPGTSYTLSAGTYNISEDPNALYTQTFGLDCVGGSVTLAPGDNKTCTIINTDLPAPPVPPPPPAPSAPQASGGGGYNAPQPLIKVVKVPSPLALPGGPGPVTYTYTVTNIGSVAMHGVWVKDNACSPVTYVSGDTNGDSQLEVNETWTYTCSNTVSQTETDIASAHGQANGWDGYALANATVVVGAPTVPPLINITKVPSRLTPFPAGGGNVTYTYSVTNPGTTALNNVMVTDDKCNAVSYVSGDANGNNLLDPGETWDYTCTGNVSVSTRNVATALGYANGLSALGYAFATVLVAAPGFPSTGFPPKGERTP